MCARRTRSRRSLTRRSLAGRVDVLFNDAGGQHLMAAEEITPKGFRTAMRLNAKSAWLISHSFTTTAMRPAGGGKVIGIAINPLAAGHFATETFMTKYPRSVGEEAASTVPLPRPEERART